MTQDEIIEMAQKCGLIGMRPHLDGIYSESLIAFANLVSAKEREACAKVCDKYNFGQAPAMIQNAIRARGEPALPIGTKLYTHPPQRTWVGLDHQDKKKFSSWLDSKTDDEVFTAIDDLLRNMNT